MGRSGTPTTSDRHGNGKRRELRAAALPQYGIAPPLADQAALDAAIDILRTRDPVTIEPLLALTGPPALRRREPGFAGLASIIVAQQVSVASADAMRTRLLAAFDPLDATMIAAADPAALRACGLSHAKTKTLHALAAAIADGTLNLPSLADRPAGDAHAALCAVHGIGPWTADVFLLFCLGHSDAWPVADIALQEAARVALHLPARPDPAAMMRLAEAWRPYRGAAAHLLWAYYRVIKARGGISLGPQA